MTIKLSRIKTLKTTIEVASVVYFIVGAFVFLGGLLMLFWSVDPKSNIKAGSYMLGSFLVIGTSLMGFIGAYTENFCMLMAYGVIQVTIFATRTISTMVVIKITAYPYETPIPPIMSGLPGTSSVGAEVIYALLEISLATCAFYLTWGISKQGGTTSAQWNPQYYYNYEYSNNYGSNNNYSDKSVYNPSMI